MRLLLDTHAWLWWAAGDDRMTQPRRDAIRDADSVAISAASVWEIALKVATGRIALSAQDLQELVHDATKAGFQRVAVDSDHALAAAHLPAHHADPFDRMLVAQAKVERMTMVTGDPALRAYDVEVLW